MSPASGPSSDFRQGFWKHGRFYGNWKPDKYQFPVDLEELNRYDIQHNFFLLARNKRVYTYEPRLPEPRVLDLGTGTGIWAIDVAENHLPDARIMAVDLNRIQPPLIPRNVEMKQFDLEEDSWHELLSNCELVHMRLLLGSIHNDLWPATYRKAFGQTRPGGRIEQVEMDWMPQWERSGDIPERSALLNWAQSFLRGMDRFQRSVRIESERVQGMMEAAGFVDFEEQTIRCYVNPWCADEHGKLVAQWFNLSLIDGVEAISLAPLVEKMGMTVDQVKDLHAAVKTECCRLRYHAFCVMHIWTARRPTVEEQMLGQTGSRG